MKKIGKATIKFENPPVISYHTNVVGPKEGEGPLGKYFDQVWKDPMMGKKTWEEAESQLQTMAVENLVQKSCVGVSEIDYIFGGDLLGQCIASSFGLEKFKRPLFGLYGACSTIGEALALAAMCIDGEFASTTVAVTSSHFSSAERQFRFPLEYGNQRPLSSTWTVTGSAAFMVSKKVKDGNNKIIKNSEPCPRIISATPGKIVNMGIRDSMNMGACMAPAACDTIETLFRDTRTTPEDYDAIITGDLGYVGHDILLDLLHQKGFDIRHNHMDCGMEIFNRKKQDTHSGGSGCACCAVVLSAYILPKLVSGEWKKILFVPTGALLSPVSFNEGRGIPGIAHGLVIASPGNCL